MKKKEYIEILKEYDTTKKKSYWTSTPKDGLEFFYDKIMLPDIMESTCPNYQDNPELIDFRFDSI